MYTVQASTLAVLTIATGLNLHHGYKCYHCVISNKYWQKLVHMESVKNAHTLERFSLSLSHSACLFFYYQRIGTRVVINVATSYRNQDEDDK